MKTVLSFSINAQFSRQKTGRKIALSAGLCKKKEKPNIFNAFKVNQLNIFT